MGNFAGAANGTTGDLQGVLEFPCRQQADPRPFALDQGIGANGRADRWGIQRGESVALPFGRPRGSNPVVDIT